MTPIANPGGAEAPRRNAYKPIGLFKMWAGDMGGVTHVYVWAHSFEDAFEVLVDWLDDQSLCGYFVTIDLNNLQDAANTLGIPWQPSWPDWNDPRFQRVNEYAEIDLTSVSHTTLSNCPNPAYIPSDQWGGDEISNRKEKKLVARRSFYEESGHTVLSGDTVVLLQDWEGIPRGTELHVTSSRPSGFAVEDPSTSDELEVEGDDILAFARLIQRPFGTRMVRQGKQAARAARLPTPPPAPPAPPAPPQRRAGQPAWAASEEERRKQQAFFKKGVPGLPKGYKGGGFLGLPRARRR